MDALTFAKMGLDELKARFAQRGNQIDSSSVNFSATPEEIVQKFFDDQGLNFTNMDIPAVLALTRAPQATETTPQDPPQNG